MGLIVIISCATIAFLCFLELAFLFQPWSHRKYVYTFTFLALSSYIMYSISTYPDLEHKRVFVHDYGTIASITPRGGKSRPLIETSDGHVLSLNPRFPLHTGDPITLGYEFEGGTATSYYTIGNRIHYTGRCEWTMPCWNDKIKFYHK